MTTYIIYARAFHPDEKFGPGGLFFEGDNRGFSYSTDTTSRIRAKWKISFFH